MSKPCISEMIRAIEILYMNFFVATLMGIKRKILLRLQILHQLLR